MEEYNSTKKELEYYEKKGILVIIIFWSIALVSMVFNNIYVFAIFIFSGTLSAMYYGNIVNNYVEKLRNMDNKIHNSENEDIKID